MTVIIIMSYSTGRPTSISPLSTVCIVSNDQLTEVIMVFFSNKWVALTRAGWCVLCGRLSGKQLSSIR